MTRLNGGGLTRCSAITEFSSSGAIATADRADTCIWFSPASAALPDSIDWRMATSRAPGCSTLVARLHRMTPTALVLSGESSVRSDTGVIATSGAPGRASRSSR